MEEKKTIHRMSIGEFAYYLKESTDVGRRFCFILGSGASVTSGIPMAKTLERRWMDCLMGVSKDGNSPAKDPADTERVANKLYSEKIIETPFERLKAAWEESKKPGGYIPSEYYFDIYKLRFYPERRNGYRYLEQLMEKAKPSVGYHPLARLLAEDNGIDIVVTTNFDSLIEDALLIFTKERPLVVAHESLADFIDLSKKQRPVIAKVHRGFFYRPLNEKESTSELSEGWKEALGEIFMQYTPIVIGYAGGDRSLMSFLEEKSTRLRNGLYWCLMKNERPAERIKKLVEAKNGCFVEISGFDDAMLTIGERFLGDSILPSKTRALIEKEARDRADEYEIQWSQWKTSRKEGQAGHEEAIARMIEAETKSTNRDDKQYLARILDEGRRKQEVRQNDDVQRYYDKTIEIPREITDGIPLCDAINVEKEEAFDDYIFSIEKSIENPDAFFALGRTYKDSDMLVEAVESLSKAIALDMTFSDAFRERARVYAALASNDEEYARYIEKNKPRYGFPIFD